MARIPLVPQKQYSNDSGDFTETTDFTILHCTNVSGNNNKFYSIELQKNPSTGNYRLFSHYGRLGTTNVYEVREFDKNGDSLDKERCVFELNKIVNKKKKGKLVTRNGEKVRETYHVVDVVSPSVGSTNICNKSNITVKHNTPIVDTSKHDQKSAELIQTITQENIHNITSNTTIKFTSQGFETPLGPVTESHLDNAAKSLDKIRDQLGSNDTLADNTITRQINSEYFSLIPRTFGYTITSSDMISTPDKLAEEYSLLDNLRTAVKAGLTSDNDSKGINIDISQLDSNDSTYERLVQKFESTKHKNHTNVRDYHICNIFNINIPSVTKQFEQTAKKLGNVKELFHGTKTANMLSIVLNGLIIPPTNAAHVTGRMFGNGVYAASCSTKALNYAVGYWGGNRNRNNKAYMLIVQFAMGKEYIATSHLYSGAPAGYDSVWAQSGHALLNDEFIVYNLNQVNITHILELEK